MDGLGTMAAMDRRAFLRGGLGQAARQIAGDESAISWIRPPYAVAEDDFQRDCSRCGDCIKACPHGVIFSLSAELGGAVADTPALNLLNHGCHLCADWPCVTACEAGVLVLPEDDPQQAPVALARVTINTETCLPYSGPECGACADSCPVGALHFNGTRPEIDAVRCLGCGMCREACIVDPKAVQLVVK